MRLPTDDELRTVDSVWLGPRGWTTMWVARYVAYGVGLVLIIAAFAIEKQVGIRLGLWSVVWTLFAVVAATRWIGTRISHETPFRSVVVTFWHEVTAPRFSAKATTARLRPGSVRVAP